MRSKLFKRQQACRPGGEGHPAGDPAAPLAEDKIRIVLDGLRGDDSIAELGRKEGIVPTLYYVWSKEFMEAGKRRLASVRLSSWAVRAAHSAAGMTVIPLLDAHLANAAMPSLYSSRSSKCRSPSD